MEIYCPKHFKAEELAPPSLTVEKTADEIFDMFDRGILRALDRLRDRLGKPITVNNWKTGGPFSQRGIRTDPNVGAPKSPHRTGRAIDFDVQGMSAASVRKWIKEHEKEFPEIHRMEVTNNGRPINWVHIDCVPHTHGTGIYLFNA